MKKQSAYTDREKLIEEVTLGRYISIIYRHSRIFMDQELAEHNFGSGQHGFLFYIFHHPGETQDEISNALCIDKATTARALRKLEQTSLIYRKNDINDRRVNHVFLTDKGIEIQHQLKALVNQWSNILLESFEIDEIEKLHEYLLRLSINCREFKATKEGISNER